MPEDHAIRPVASADLPSVARLAAELVRYHRALDPLRYLAADGAEQGYVELLTREIQNPKAVVLCATPADGGDAVGYTYATLEERDWSMLLDPHGALHDVFVDGSVRRSGLAQRLVEETIRRLEGLGAPRVVLYTAVQNSHAQALFAKLGFRSTMIELTRERPPA
jgi:ribosomal protein S18 acetylase RimI-like enzyme